MTSSADGKTVPVSQRLPPLQDHAITVLAQPKTCWTELTASSSIRFFAICNIVSLALFTLATASTLLLIRSLFAHSWNSNTIKGCALIALISAVFAGVFRYLANTDGILILRNEVKSKINSIEKFTLSYIRMTYRDEKVITDGELNEWARYFLHTQPFDFLRFQWSSIFDFNLEQKTEDLIKEKCRYRIFHPDDPSNLELLSEILDSKIFPQEERASIQQFQRETRSLNLNVTPFLEACEKCKKYEDLKKHAAFPKFEDDRYLIHAWLFSIFIWRKKIGIQELKKDHATEMDKFSSFFQHPLEQYLADREALSEEGLTYQAFIDRNGKDAVCLITNLHRFFSLVLQANLGLLKTKNQFEGRIKYFGVEAQLEEAVLQQEWENMTSYTEVRDRNGDDKIKSVKDPEIKRQLVRKFLELPAPELAETDKYKEERKALGVLDQQVNERLIQMWGGMSFEKILGLDDLKIRELILKEVAKSETAGRLKAIREIQRKPVKEVLRVYKLLFPENKKSNTTDKAPNTKDEVPEANKTILVFNDYAFKVKLASVPSKELVQIIEEHGEFIENEEIGWFQEKSQELMGCVFFFLSTAGKQFLDNKTLPKDGMWKWLKKFNLIPEFFTQLQDDTIQLLEIESQRYTSKLRDLEKEHQDAIKKIDGKVVQEKSELEKKGGEEKRKLDEAQEKLDQALIEHEQFQTDLKKWNKDLDETQNLLEQKQAALEIKQGKKAQLDNMPKTLEYLEGLCTQGEQSLVNLEERIKEEIKQGSDYIALSQFKEALEKQLGRLREEKEALQEQQAQIVTKYQTLHDRGNEEGKSDGKTNPIAPSKDKLDSMASPDQTDLQSLDKQLEPIVGEIDKKTESIRQCRQEIREKNLAIDRALEAFSQHPEYIRMKQGVDEHTGQIKDAVVLKKKLEEECRDLGSLDEEVKRISKKLQALEGQRSDNNTRKKEVEREVYESEYARDHYTEKYKSTAAELLKFKSTRAHTLTQEAKLVDLQKKEQEKITHQKAEKGIKDRAEQKLKALCKPVSAAIQ